MTNEEAVRLARTTAATWISERLEAGWPPDRVCPEDRRRLRGAMTEVLRVLLPGADRKRQRKKARKEKPATFFDAPTRVRRPSETVPPVELPPDMEVTVSGEDSTLRGDTAVGSLDPTLPPD